MTIHEESPGIEGPFPPAERSESRQDRFEFRVEGDDRQTDVSSNVIPSGSSTRRTFGSSPEGRISAPNAMSPATT